MSLGTTSAGTRDMSARATPGRSSFSTSHSWRSRHTTSPGARADGAAGAAPTEAPVVVVVVVEVLLLLLLAVVQQQQLLLLLLLLLLVLDERDTFSVEVCSPRQRRSK
jgi:hypothetical protein